MEGIHCIEDTQHNPSLKIQNIKVLSIGSILSSIRYEPNPPFWWKWGIITGWKKAHVHNMMRKLVPADHYLRLECDITQKIGIDFNIEQYKELFQLKAKELVSIQKDEILNFFLNKNKGLIL